MIYEPFSIGRRGTLTSLCACASMLIGAALPAQEIPTYAPLPELDPSAALPTVVLMSMGGTIASRGTPRLNVTNYGGAETRRVEPEDWYHDLPELAGIANIVLEDQRAPQNTEPGRDTLQDWRCVARRLNELAADPSIDGIVVTHGTNIMAETAYYMNLVVATEKPIVFVGAQRPWTGLSGDGPRNLYDAIRVAASKDAWGKGVLHAMNQVINTARDVDKTSAYRVDTFEGVDVGAIGFADPDKVVFYREPVRRHTSRSEFASIDFETLPKVEVVLGYRDAPGYLIDAMVSNGIDGLIIEGTGAGSLTSSQTEAVERAKKKGVVVVATARTHGGRVQTTPRRTAAGIIPGDNLLPEKARILLQLALATTRDPVQIGRIFGEY